MSELLITLGGPSPKGGGSAGKPKKGGFMDGALADFMKSKGKPAPDAEEPAEETEPSAAEEAGKEAAQELADAAKAGDGEGVWAAFKKMCEAHEGLGSDEAEPDAAEAPV